MTATEPTYRINPTAERQARFRRVASMVTGLIGAGRLDPSAVPAIEEELRRLGQLIDVSYDELATAQPTAQPEEEPAPPPELADTSEDEPAPAQAGGVPENIRLAEYPPVVLTKSERRRANEKAVNLLQKQRIQLSAEDLSALRLYTGQGGLGAEDAESALRALNEHYTSYPLIQMVWDKLAAMGFSEGNVFEPGAGIGNFAGFKPEGVDMVMVERSKVSGRIAELLYPEDLVIKEDLAFADLDAYQLTGAVGNVPFGSYQVHSSKDPLARYSPSIHNYFILRALEEVQPGGVVALITSTSTMDSKTTTSREAMAERAAFVAAYRLPSSAFKDNADTHVTTDLLIFQKHPEGGPDLTAEQEELQALVTADPSIHTIEAPKGSGELREAPLNKYFEAHPGQVLGELIQGHQTQFATQFGVRGQVTDEMLASVVSDGLALPYDVPDKPTLYRTDGGVRLPVGQALPSGALIEYEGQFYEKEHRTFQPADSSRIPEGHRAEVKSALGLLEALAQYVRALAGGSVQELQGAVKGGRDDATRQRKALSGGLEDHIDRHGLPQESAALREALRYDPRRVKLFNLARLDEDTGELALADVLQAGAGYYNDTYTPHLEDSEDLAALTTYLRASGEPLTAESYASVYRGGTATTEEVIEAMALDEDFYWDPEAGEAGRWTFKYEYLAGDVRTKLTIAEEEGLDHNAEALRAALPPQLSVYDIALTPKHIFTYLPASTVEAWLEDTLGYNSVSLALVDTVDSERFVDITNSKRSYNRRDAERGWGGEPYSKLVHLYLNNRRISRKVVDEEGNILNVALKEASEEQTRRATRFREVWQARLLTQIPEDFQTWVRLNAPQAVREQVERRYNAAYSSHANPPFDGSTFQVRGMSNTFKGIKDFWIFPHNLRVAEKMLWRMNGGDCHDVGSGKTIAAIITLMAAQQRGSVRKPMLVVPGQVIEKWADEIHDLFPDAKILNLRLAGQAKDEELAKAQLYDWDFILIPDHAFKRLPLSPKEQKRRLEERIAYYQGLIDNAVDKIAEEHGAKAARRMQKRLAKALAKFQARLKELSEQERRETDIFFDELGVDALMFDEAHFYKNALGSPRAIKLGIATSDPSQRAEDALQKAEWVRERTGGRNTWILTATPVKNSPIEVWHMLALSAPDVLEKYKIEYLDDFVSLFIREERKEQKTVSGRYASRLVVGGYDNLPEMRRIIDERLDVASYDQLQAWYQKNPVYDEDGNRVQPFSRPEHSTDHVMVPPSEVHEMLFEDIGHRADIVLEAMKDKDAEINDNFLVLTGDGSNIATDLRLYDEEMEGFNDEYSLKLGHLIQQVEKHYQGAAGEVPAARENPHLAGSQDGLVAAGTPLTRPNPSDPADSSSWPRNQIVFVDKVAEKSGDLFPLRLKRELAEAGIPKDQIAVVNGQLITRPNEKGEVVDRRVSSGEDKEELKLDVQERFNRGEYRVLIGNQTIQEGMNLDRWCVAIHHLDVPYTPASIQQRNGRGVRQGNRYDFVQVLFYLMKESFDEYRLQLVAKKQNWIDELFYGSGRDFSAEEESKALTYEEMMAATSADPRVKEYFEALQNVRRLTSEVADYSGQVQRMEASISTLRLDIERDTERTGPTIEQEQMIQERALRGPEGVETAEQAVEEGYINIGRFDELPRWMSPLPHLKGMRPVYKAAVELSLTETRVFPADATGFQFALDVPESNRNGRVYFDLNVPGEAQRKFYAQKSLLNLMRYAYGREQGEANADAPLFRSEYRRLANQDDFYAYYNLNPETGRGDEESWAEYKDRIGMDEWERWEPVVRERLADLLFRAERRWYERSEARVENLQRRLSERRATLDSLEEQHKRAGTEYDEARRLLDENQSTVATLREVVNELVSREHPTRAALYEALNEIAPQYGLELPVRMRVVGDRDEYFDFLKSIKAGGEPDYDSLNLEGAYVEAADAAEEEIEEAEEAAPAAAASDASASIEVVDLPMGDVHVDPERFQPRGEPFSEETARKVAENRNPQLMNEIVVWRDPEDGKIYVLAGHSRREGYRRREEPTIPGRFFEGTEEEAIRFAHIENEKGSELTPAERAAYVRSLLEAGSTYKEIEAEARDLYGRNAATIIALAHLNPSGKAMQTLQAFAGNSTGEARDTETMAVWIGKLRRAHKELTDSHENEIFDWLQGNYKTQGRRVSSFLEFREILGDVIERRTQFSEGGERALADRLNFQNLRPRSRQQTDNERQIAQAEKELRRARRLLDQQRARYIERGAEAEQLARILAPYEDEVRALQRYVLELKREAQAAGGQLKAEEQDLFAQVRDNPMSRDVLVYIGRTGYFKTTSQMRVAEALEEDPHFMFMDARGSQLLIVPPEYVTRAPQEIEAPRAEAAYEMWHGFPENEEDLMVWIPEARREEAGTAEEIRYTSDKLVQAGDRDGLDHTYTHDFDAGRRPVYKMGRALLVENLKITERGILN